MKKLSDYISFIKGYKIEKSSSKFQVKMYTLTTIMWLLNAVFQFLTMNYIMVFSALVSASLFSFVVAMHALDLKKLNTDYKRACEAVSSFAKELNDKGIKISKDSLVKSNVHTNKHINDMKIINANLDGTEKDIKIIEEPRSDSIHENNNNFSMIPSPRGMEESVYYVDKDLVVDNNLSETFNGKARIKRRSF